MMKSNERREHAEENRRTIEGGAVRKRRAKMLGVLMVVLMIER